MTKERTSNQSLSRHRADSAPKLNHNLPKNIQLPNVPVLEVSFSFGNSSFSLLTQTVFELFNIKITKQKLGC